MKALRFTVPGTPVGKGRPRIVRIAGQVRNATPQKTAAYEGLVAHAGQQAMAGRSLLLGAVSVVMDIVLEVPASWSGKQQKLALAGSRHPTKKPDIDNVEKAIFDGLNGVVWKDDVQVVDVCKRKRYGQVPGVTIEIEELETAAA